MLVSSFNKAWETERAAIEATLVEKLDKEIREIQRSASGRGNSDEWILELDKLRANLILRKSFAVFESEEIARQRMQLRASYMAVLMSATALLISVVGVLLR